jgi:hypothetical protein
MGEEFIQSFNQPKYPKVFIAELIDGADLHFGHTAYPNTPGKQLHKSMFKVTANPLGQKVLCGTYK